MFGSTCRTATRQAGLPTERAASTYSLLAASRVAARATRMKRGAVETPMAIMALVRSGPRKAASAIARIRKGQASMASTTRDSSASVQPLANPATRPAGTPMPAAISTETTPASRLARAPKITRDSTSRPFSSVPIQCARDGALRMADHDVAIGS